LKTLEVVINSYKGVQHGNNDRFQNERWRKANEKMAFLGPILDVLKEIHGRLDALEKKE
jgi:hypothetical protein